MEMLAEWASKKEKEEMVKLKVRCWIGDDAEYCLVRQKMWVSLPEVLLHT